MEIVLNRWLCKITSYSNVDSLSLELGKTAKIKPWNQIESSLFTDMKAAHRGLDVQPLQVNGDNICKTPLASVLQIEATFIQTLAANLRQLDFFSSLQYS